MDENFLAKAYSGQKVLITGHTGFKGAWLSIWLKSLGAKVIGFSLDPPTEPNMFSAVGLGETIVDIRGDIRDFNHLQAVFGQYKPDIVFHLAAQSLVRYSYVDPKLTFDTNIGGTVNILEATRLSESVKALINITSDKCYENKEWIWGYRENDPMGGHDPYSASKGCCELVFSAYQKSFFPDYESKERIIGLASVRAGNVIGGGDWATDRLIPDCIRAITSGDSIKIRNPHSIRPWQHVLEPLFGYLWIGQRLLQNPEKYSGGWNLGPNDSHYLPVKKVVDILIRKWGAGEWNDVSDKHGQLHEATLLKLNCDKVRALLGWSSVLSIEECLQFTVDWYKLYYAKAAIETVYDLCLKQVRQYTEKANLLYVENTLCQNNKQHANFDISQNRAVTVGS